MWQRVKNVYHLMGAVFAAILYGFPGNRLIVIGLTGTDGKTTTASLIYHILKNSGKKVVLISTVGAKFNDTLIDTGFHTTTPSTFFLQRLLKKAVKKNLSYVVLEVTSHALDQFRVWGIPFEIGILTNVSDEHLDYHKTYENYLATKFKLLQNAKVAIVNRDDKSYQMIKDSFGETQDKKGLMTNDKKIISYGLDKESDVNPLVFPFKTKLLGEFNQYNCLAAIAATKELGVSNENIQKALKSFTPPKGRQEIVYDKEFKIIIDFAHTPNSFQQILPKIKRLTKGRLIHVFGSAGERDAFKRQQMGKISSKYADGIVLTSEDSRSEPQEKIIDEIASGIQNSEFRIQNWKDNRNRPFDFAQGKKCLFKIPDRKEAIEFATSLLKKDDVLLLTGKGHEQSINYGNGEEPWDEASIALEALRKCLKSFSSVISRP